MNAPNIRPRTIITADPELDDLNSLIRLLLYTNEIELEGLVYASSRYHWRGDVRGTEFYLPDRGYGSPQTSWRWSPGERFIHDAIDAYERVYENLIVHDPRYPVPDSLRAIIRDGNVDFEGDTSAETPGSALIVDALLNDRPGPLFLQLWAGPSTVARALMTIEERFGQDADWPRVHERVSSKTVITKFASQDATYDDYIAPRWPGIRVIEVGNYSWGYPARITARPEDAYLLQTEWMRENITSVGPLGTLYRVWGDGRQMVSGDKSDYFHLSGFTADELRGQGYRVWIEPQPAGEWISEGDSTNMLNLIVPSLRAHEDPGFGGWGGRYVRTPQGRDTWALVDGVFGGEGDEASITRWFADAQTDFAGRLRWTVTPIYADANHHPVLHLDQSYDTDVQAGAEVPLSATFSDPDGNAVTCHWWIDDGPSSVTGATLLCDSVGTATVRVPPDALPAQTIHVIAEAQDNGVPSLKTYQRLILTIRGDQ